MGVAPSIEHQKILTELNCDFVLDVGANRGQFSLISRMVKPAIPILAFEPIPTEADIFRKALSGVDGSGR
jgi:predicted RNA methylase